MIVLLISENISTKYKTYHGKYKYDKTINIKYITHSNVLKSEEIIIVREPDRKHTIRKYISNVNRYELNQIFIHEYGHHVHEKVHRKIFESYKKSVGWKNGEKIRPGNFLTEDSKHSAEEDFATNFEAFVLDEQRLKNDIPKVYMWMKKNLKNKFLLKECAK